ncbi:hypothetical protein [Acinetobacter sp. YH16044]|uniref:hypothetical protein n=1 Tax=Acinetobacter sp. YH16044 TaxID=2601187 RepID=UPI0015D393F9|nr:hypothetical protein [Acinetobacter sp. YH16044]
MGKKLEDLIRDRSSESQNRILENAQTMLNDCLSEDVHLAEKVKGQKTIKITLDGLRARVHKKRA